MLWLCVLLSTRIFDSEGYVASPLFAWRGSSPLSTSLSFTEPSFRSSPLPNALRSFINTTPLYSEISGIGTTAVADYEEPEDSVIQIKPAAMLRLRELKEKQSPDSYLVLRMGVRNGGCSGLSYVMDFSTEDDIQEEDAVDDYKQEGIKCVVDSKSMLYLFGLQLDFSDELIGGGFKFFNPNAEESCGCGSSFGV